MADTPVPISPIISTIEKIFPRLTPEQVSRVSKHGRLRSVLRDEILFRPGESAAPFFVVVSGQLEIVRPSRDSDTLVTNLGPGQFSGEINLISGRPPLVRIRALEAGEVIELDRERLLGLVQTDNELGELLMGAF